VTRIQYNTIQPRKNKTYCFAIYEWFRERERERERVRRQNLMYITIYACFYVTIDYSFAVVKPLVSIDDAMCSLSLVFQVLAPLSLFMYVLHSLKYPISQFKSKQWGHWVMALAKIKIMRNDEIL